MSNDMRTTIMKFKQELYPKEAVMKAAYHFINRCYIHVDITNGEYVIEIITKKDSPEDVSEYEFENELLAQTVRYQVYTQTHILREILMARAMSSTITGIETEYEKASHPRNLDSLDNILRDWFEKNE